jgi:hypothetical protein
MSLLEPGKEAFGAIYFTHLSTAASLLISLNLTGRDKGGYYHELFLRSKRFLSHRIQRMKIKGTGARKPGSPDTEPNFYNAPFLPSTSVPSKSAQIAVVGGTMASGPNMYPGTGGAMSLRQVLSYPTFGASLSHQEVQFAPPPLFSSSANLLMEAQQAQAQAQAQRQQLRMVPFYQDMHAVAGFGQQNIPMASDIDFGQRHMSMVGWPQYDPSTAIALALSHIEQDQATLARSRSLYMQGRD